MLRHTSIGKQPKAHPPTHPQRRKGRQKLVRRGPDARAHFGRGHPHVPGTVPSTFTLVWDINNYHPPRPSSSALFVVFWRGDGDLSANLGRVSLNHRPAGRLFVRFFYSKNHWKTILGVNSLTHPTQKLLCFPARDASHAPSLAFPSKAAGRGATNPGRRQSPFCESSCSKRTDLLTFWFSMFGPSLVGVPKA